jgi:hypothetical protein
MRVKVPVVPASFFGMVIGLAGLGAALVDVRRTSQRSSTCIQLEPKLDLR